MRVLNSTESLCVAGGDDLLLILALEHMSPENRNKAIDAIIVGHATVWGAGAAGVVTTGLLWLFTESPYVLIGGAIVGAIGGGYFANGWATDFLQK